MKENKLSPKYERKTYSILLNCKCIMHASGVIPLNKTTP